MLGLLRAAPYPLTSDPGKMSLIDFGACREYRKDFVDDYFRLVWSAANRDEAEIMRVWRLTARDAILILRG